VAVLSAATVVLVVIAVLAWSRRTADAQDDRIAAVVSDMNERMEAMLQELSAALERAEEESRRSRTLGELGGSIDLDEVLARALDAACAMQGVDAGLISYTTTEGKPFVATLGLTQEEAEA